MRKGEKVAGFPDWFWEESRNVAIPFERAVG